MKVVSPKNMIYAAICLLLFAVSLYSLKPIWFLFLALSIYFLYRSFNKIATVGRVENNAFVPKEFGVIGTYAVEGDPNDSSCGLYIILCGKPVFVDIRQDNNLDLRKAQGLALSNYRAELEASLTKFISENPEFQNQNLKSIGLHSANLEEGDVFWEPDGHTLLSGLKFEKANRASSG